MHVRAYVRLMRPANIITAIADILMGFAASGAAIALIAAYSATQNLGGLGSLFWLVVATCGLYGGGVVFNDVFDAELDRIERPERPIPSGDATVTGATTLGILLLAGGILAAWQVSLLSALIATGIAICALVYDWKGKHHPILGPLNMGACRGGNLLLGISAIPVAVGQLWYLAFIPIIYISAITMVSRGEVHGGSKGSLYGAVLLYTVVILGIASLVLLPQFNLWYSFPFLVLFAVLIFPPLYKAVLSKEPVAVMQAVKAGILALIVMDASMAAGFAGWKYGLLVLLLLPVSRFVAKKFAVT